LVNTRHTEELGSGPASDEPSAAKPIALEVKVLWTGYDKQPVLEDISFQVAQGEILGIIGPNGSGKTTLLNTLLGLQTPWRGEVLIMGQPAHRLRKKVGYMPQVERVDWDFPVTVGDVALMGRYNRRGFFQRTNKEDRELAGQALHRVGMYGLRDSLIGQLSVGQRRRALLARALANQPPMLLLDEPMAGLDATAQHQILDLLDELRAEGTTVILSTHDLSCVSAYCDNAACLNRKLIAYGPPSQVLNEQVLSETFGTHLLLVHIDGQAYAYQHHTHQAAPPSDADPKAEGHQD
jgi:ABC-type Mn2+/Zn2+ transport system ATPase subunit